MKKKLVNLCVETDGHERLWCAVAFQPSLLSKKDKTLSPMIFTICFTYLLSLAAGHGAMQFPTSRNVHTTHYCPQCANGPSVCGSGGNSQWPADDSAASLLKGAYTTPLTQLVAGGMVEVEAFFTAAHMGHFALELCTNPSSSISEDCFVKLERDPSDTRYCPYASSAPWAAILPTNQCTTGFSSGSPLRVRYKVPSTTSDHAVLRWYWQTGNSCDSLPEAQTSNAPSSVKNWSASINGKTCTAALSGSGNLCGSDCPNPSCANEQFKNCADVQIVSGSSSTIVTSSNSSTGSSSGGSSSGSGSSGSGSGSSGTGSGNPGSGSGNESGSSGTGSGGSSSGSGSGSGSSGNGSGGSASGEVSSCQASVGSDNPAWDEDCKSKCEFYAANPIYCGGVALVECVKRMAAYC